jgi:hypothetical protein
MKKLNVVLAILVAAVMTGNAQVSSEPVGYVNVKITAGTGTAKRLSYLSFPLIDKDVSAGKTRGTITGVTSTTITDSTAGWTPGGLSAPTTPCLIGITSGTAVGRIFHISSSAITGGAVGTTANTATTVTISSLDTTSGTDPVAAGVTVGDSYEIYGCDTLASLLGSPSTTGVLSGASAAVADSVVMVVNGTASTFFHNGTRWTKVTVGNPDASNTPVLPYYGLAYSRLKNTEITLTTLGTVPTKARKTQIKNSGLTLFSQYFPVDTTLLSLGLQNTPGWTAHPSNSNLADKVVLVSGGTASTYWYSGTGWKRVTVGSPSADTTAITAGAMVYISRYGSTPGFSTYSLPLPYTL